MRSNRRPAGLADDLALNPMFTQDVEQGPVPRDRFPRRGMLPDNAYQLIHDELLLDGNSRQNVATFGTTDGAQGGLHRMSSGCLRSVQPGRSRFLTWGYWPTAEIEAVEPSFDLNDYPETRRVLERQVTSVIDTHDPLADRAEVSLLVQAGDRLLAMLPLVAKGMARMTACMIAKAPILSRALA